MGDIQKDSKKGKHPKRVVALENYQRILGGKKYVVSAESLEEAEKLFVKLLKHVGQQQERPAELT